MEADKSVGSVMTNDVVSAQPLPSVTVKEYVPGPSLEIELVAEPFDQE
jgi:hypothetical protein